MFPFLLGFVPEGPTPAVHVGPAAPHLDREPALQHRLDRSVRAREVRAALGPVPIRWDPRTGTPRTVLLPGLPAESLVAVVGHVAHLAGLDPDVLVYEGVTRRGARAGHRWQQHHRGVPVEGATVDVFELDDRLQWVVASLHPVVVSEVPRPGEVVLPLPDGDRVVYRVARVTAEGDEVVFHDRAGAELWRYTERRYLELTLQERTIGDPLITVPARQVQVAELGGAGAVTDDAGAHGLTGPLDVTLSGPALSITRDGRPIEEIPIDDGVIDAFVDVTGATSTVQHWTHEARDWLMAVDPTNPWPGDVVVADVDVARSTCNAFYVGGTINFFRAGGGCENFGQIADVVLHEYGHGVHEYGLLGGVRAGDVGEGSADFIGATRIGDPVVGIGARGPGTHIRELDTDRVYPDDVTGEVHADGLIWGSMWWNLREAWVAQEGPALGVQHSDELFLRTLSAGPTLTDAFEAMLAADDDDGDLTNGTPHDCELVSLLDQHGLGPGPMGWVVASTSPIPDQPSGSPGAMTTFDVALATPGCGDFDPDSVTLWWTVDPHPDVPVDHQPFVPVTPVRSGSTYTATLPALPAGSHVAWFVDWTTLDGTVVQATHGGELGALERFVVGDRQSLWCDGFESGDAAGWTFGEGALDDADPGATWISEWAVSEPTGLEHNPDTAFDGTFVLGTAVTSSRVLLDNDQHALAPALDLGSGSRSLLRLTTQRWLTVERSAYDVARVVALHDDGYVRELWRNPVDVDLLDTRWTPHTVDLRSLHDEGPVALGWTLATDGGKQFGGWALDEVCVETLAEPEVHYRVADLRVERTDAVGLSWTEPYVVPLYATALVRSADGVPTSIDDGVIVDLDLQPSPGAARAVVDADASLDEDWHYAVFVAEAADGWYDGAVLGENAASTPAPASSTATGGAPEDEEKPALSDEGAAGCGCATTAPTTPLAVSLPLGFGGLLRRRPVVR